MATVTTTYDPSTSGTSSNLICTACGTQYPTSDRTSIKTCFICDDPRQYVPPSGQSFTTLSDLTSSASGYHNVFTPYGPDSRLISIHTVPKLGIGQRAILIRTPNGNILWDCLTFLDIATVARINNLGGLSAIVISHPHYYSTHVEWAQAFNCKVYLAREDEKWTAIKSAAQVFLDKTATQIPGRSGADCGVTAIKLGGHFPGSMVLLFDQRLMIADTLLTTPAGVGKWEVDATGEERPKPPGLNTFAFMWSVPNFIPLDASALGNMWMILQDYDFKSTHGAFTGQDIEDPGVKDRVWESMKIQIKYMNGDRPSLT